MSKRKLPAAETATRPGLRTELFPSALNRWNPEVRSAAEVDTSISILDVIGADFFGEGVTAKRIAAALRAIGEEDITVNINSPGGDFFEGLAIYNLLREHKAKVTVKILGMAASAASVIAMAGDEIQIARGAFMMIHNTWVCGCGDRHGLRDIADWLEPFDNAAIDIYEARTGMKRAELGKMLDRETWLGGSEAIDKGFADALLPADEIASEPKNTASGEPLAAAHKLDTLLARLNIPRSERRDLIRALKGDTPGAVASGMPGAAVIAEVEDLLQSIKRM